MKNLTLAIVFFFLPNILFSNSILRDNQPMKIAQQKRATDALKGRLQYGQPMQVVYDIEKSDLKNILPNPKGLIALIYKNSQDPPEYLDMVKKGESWETTFTLTDTSVKMIMVAFQGIDSLGLRHPDLIADNNGEYWDMLVTDPTGKPVQGAHQIRALSFSGMGGKRNENLQRAFDEIKNELSLYPDNLSARKLLYTILLSANDYDDSIRKKIEREINSLLRENPNDETFMNFAVTGYRMIGKTDKAQKIENELIKRNPKGNQAAMNALDEIMNLEDIEIRAQRLNTFLEEFPNSTVAELALSSLATAAIELDDSTKMVDVGNKLMEKASTPIAASGLAGIAGVFSEKQYRLDRASAYAKKALTLIQSSDISSKPAEMSIKEWEQQRRTTEARYRDILGWIYVHQGKMEQAISELRESVKGTSQPGVQYHFASALEKSGAVEEALLNYARAVAYGGEIGDIAYQAFYDLWLKTGKQEEDMEPFLNKQDEWIRNYYEKRVLSHRSIRPAPEFELEDLEGGWVRLSDQIDNIILLCFWASWSESSWQMLKEIHTLSRYFGEDILFLTISTDHDYYTVKDYVEKKRIFLPVLLNDGTDQDYGLMGVPTLFIIDGKGKIHFEHKGYRPGIQEMLAVELEDLLKSENK